MRFFFGKIWKVLRFPCCGRAFPCDTCHEEASLGHEMKVANRMICGHCSTEQVLSLCLSVPLSPCLSLYVSLFFCHCFCFFSPSLPTNPVVTAMRMLPAPVLTSGKEEKDVATRRWWTSELHSLSFNFFFRNDPHKFAGKKTKKAAAPKKKDQD